MVDISNRLRELGVRRQLRGKGGGRVVKGKGTEMGGRASAFGVDAASVIVVL